jgi:hypothetical protein
VESKFAVVTTVDQAMAHIDKSDDLVMYYSSTPREFDGPVAVRAVTQGFLYAFKSFMVEFINLP